MMTRLRLIGAAMLAALFAAEGRTSLVTYYYSGTTTYTTFAGAAGTFEGSVTFDTSDPALHSYSVYTAYNGTPVVRLTSGSLTATLTGEYAGANFETTQVANNWYMGDQFSVYAALKTPDVNGLTEGHVILTDSSATAFSDTSLPPSIDPAAFDEKYVYFAGGGNQFSGTITAFSASPLSSSVPEPASWTLLVGGFAMTGTGLRRRRAAIA